MSTELKDRIQEDLRKRNITPRSVIQTTKNSLNGIRTIPFDYVTFQSIPNYLTLDFFSSLPCPL